MTSKDEKDRPRPPVKKLFSFDQIKSHKTRRSSSENDKDNGSSSWFRHGRAVSKPALNDVEEDGSPDAYDEYLRIHSGIITSPKMQSSSSLPMRSMTPESFRSASPARRWDQLRQHVVPPEPSAPSQQRLPAPPPPTKAASTKSSRLAKLGFRHVVDEAKQADDARKLGEEISRLCFAVQYPQSSSVSQASGSSMTLPFMSSSTLILNNAGATKKSDTGKRPPSTPAFPNAPSLKTLYQVLMHHAATSDVSSVLPKEDKVLSALLAPFLVRSPKWEEERIIALETFELVSKGWIAPDAVDRVVWCCKAAMIPPSTNRSRVLSMLRQILVPGDRNKSTLTLTSFQTICHHLLAVLAFLHSPASGAYHEGETILIKDLINKFVAGSHGDFSPSDVEEEYSAAWLSQDSRAATNKAVFLEAMVQCIDNCSQATRQWLLLNSIEEYWPHAIEFTSLQMCIHSRKINTFCKAVSRLVKTTEESTVVRQAMTLLRERVIPEVGLMDTTVASRCRASISQLALDLLSLEHSAEALRWSVDIVCSWLHDENPHWKVNLDKTFERVISDGSWPAVVRLLTLVLDQLPENDRKIVVSTALPILNERILNDPPPYPSAELAQLLNNISRRYPHIFFKPMLLCAGSTKDLAVINHLCTLVVYSKFVDDLWLRDADMISFALLSDVGTHKQASNLDTIEGSMPWAVARLGQSVLIVELIGQLQEVRRKKDLSNSALEIYYASVAKFVTALESRLSLLIAAKEKTLQIPPSQRMLLCMLLREMRLLTKSLKQAQWLQRTVQWFITFFDEDDIAEQLEDEVEESMERIHAIFLAARDGTHQTRTRRSTFMFASTSTQLERSKVVLDNTMLDVGALFDERRPLLDGLLKGFPSKAMKLFVSVSALLSDENYLALGSLLWERCLGRGADSPSTAPACFLLMQCAERATMNFLARVEVDMRSSDDSTRLEAVRKMGILINWRFQIMSQNLISERGHRPFKMARLPLPFVATDMGTTLYVPGADDTYDHQDSDIPPELRKQLAELGWAEENASAVDPQRERRRTPMSLLPVTQLEKMELNVAAASADPSLPPVGSAASPMPSPHPSPGIAVSARRLGGSKAQNPQDGEDPASLLRRSSTSGGLQSSQKRRAIFVPPLSLVFLRLSKLVFDPNFLVAAASRATLFDLMRNDPPLLTRPVMDLFAGDNKDIATAVTTFSTYLHTHNVLPPPMTHNIFNSILGFLKYASRQLDLPETLHEYALVLPVLANVITQVNGMSMREVRRSKADPLVIPTGSLWFSDSAPRGPMFPRGFDDFANPFEDVSLRVISTSIIRTSQNLLFLAMLKRNSQDVTLIRKNAVRLVLPSMTEDTLVPRSLDLKEMLPATGVLVNPPETTIESLSVVFARSHLMLVAQVFRSMSRHLSDRNELALWIDGINKILCKHGHDIGIIGHALTALMVATTRFRRLFTSGTGYTLFIPALVKVYTESPVHPGIRPAIEYALNRFYALHAESFLYQALGVIGQMSMMTSLDETTFANSVYSMFFSLTKGISSFTVDAAGIHNINKSQEREAMIVNTAEEKPQTFLASIRRTELQTVAQLSTLFPEEYETERLRMDNFVRLFLTVIAHDLTIVRAQHYLRLLRMLTPALYQASGSTRGVLVDGILAMSSILLKGPKSKLVDTTASRIAGDDHTLLSSHTGMEHHSSEQSRIQSDLKTMRIDFLHLVLKYRKAGGEVPSKVVRQALEIVKVILKDSTSKDASNAVLSQFLSDFVNALLLQEPHPDPRFVTATLQTLSPVLHAYMGAIDMSGILDAVHRLTLLPVYANNRYVSRVIVGEICTAGLAACELAASENQLEQVPYRPALVRLIAECVFLEGADVVEEIEKRTPTYNFLAGIVLPLAIVMKTEAQINADGLRTQERHRSVLASGWLRLLFYIIAACQKSAKAEPLQRTKTKEKKERQRAAFKNKLTVFVMSLQILKIIVLRAEVDISSSIPGIWERIAGFLKAMLSDGSADFAIRVEIPSTFNSPTASPRVSAQLETSPSGWNTLGTSHSFPFAPHISIQDHMFSRPRVIDYMLWSMLEFLWAYRSPLRLQLRLLTMEKTVDLDRDLHKATITPMSSPRRHRISSVFAKIRNRAPSPEASPRLTPSASLLPEPSPAFLDVRRPGYQISPTSPSETRPIDGPQIVHLGPASPSTFQTPHSPGIAGPGAPRTMIRTLKFRSLKLAEATYRRIRGVQALMGYDMLLPLPKYIRDSEENGAVLKTWTQSQALAAINGETRDLLEEFELVAAALDEEDDAASISIEVQPEGPVATLPPLGGSFRI